MARRRTLRPPHRRALGSAAIVAEHAQPSIALVPWGDVIEDWLAPLGLSFRDFHEEMTGGWMFGYVEALKRAGVRTVLFCCSKDVARPTRVAHRPTGAVIWAYPPARRFALLEGRHLHVTDPRPWGPTRAVRALRWHAGPYFGTRLLALARVLRRERCAAILCQDYETPRFDELTALGSALGVPCFASFQGGNVQSSRLERPLRPLTLRAAAGLIVPARAEAERVRAAYGTPPEKIGPIFNPLDLAVWRPAQARDRERVREELGLPAEAIVVVSHGRIDIDDKGLDVLLEAWRQVVGRRPDAELRLLLVGSGNDAPVLRRWLATGDWPAVRWVDEFVLDRERMRDLVGCADLYAFAGRYEGFPVAPIEAMACGVPVVASDASGVPDILTGTPRPGGIMVDRDDAAGLARAVGALVDDPQRRAELARDARRWVQEHCSLERVGAQLAAFLGLDGGGATAR